MLDEKHLARFFSKLKLYPETGCMEWQCGTANGGYGCFSINRHPYRAHRVAAYLAGMIDIHDYVTAYVVRATRFAKKNLKVLASVKPSEESSE